MNLTKNFNLILNNPLFLFLDFELTAEISDALKWLKVMPWETVEEKWKLTLEYRHSCLLKSRKNITTGRKKGKRGKNTDNNEKAEKYIDTCKILRERKGYMLVNICPNYTMDEFFCNQIKILVDVSE